MGCPRPACRNCARNCLLIHGKNKDLSPVVTSFFKVMFTDKYSEVLFLPPKFARTMRDLVNKEIQLEDAIGQRWTVTLSRCDGSLAFQQGWHSFSLEHALRVGDFVVFHYILGSHFLVQIYGKNGCERIHFSGENGSRKKRRTNQHCAEDGKYCSIDGNSMNKQGQGNSALSGSNMEIVTDNTLDIGNGSPRKMLNEEQLCMIGMDARHRHEDHRNSLYDLLDLEMQRTSDVDGTTRVLEHERSPCHGNRMSMSQAGADIVDKIPVTEKVVSLDVPNLEIPETNEDFQMTEKVVVVSKQDSGNGNTSGQQPRKKTRSSTRRFLISQKEGTPIMPSCQNAQQKSASTSEFGGLKASVQTENYQSAGEIMEEAKTKQFEMKTELCDLRDSVNGKYPESKEGQGFNHPVQNEDHVFKVVKSEPVDTFELDSADSVTISLMVTETKPFLELPKSLPVFSSRGRPAWERRAVVLLRDPLSRLWPVIYQEKSGIKVLTGGWEVFRKANSIRVGDECAFKVENRVDWIFKVSIVRNKISSVHKN